MLQFNYISNAGIVLSDGADRILVDVLYEGYPGFDYLPEDFKKAIMHSESPYAHVMLLTSTHAHMDHYSPLLVREYARLYPDVRCSFPRDLPFAEQGILHYMEGKPCRNASLFRKYTTTGAEETLHFTEFNFEEFCSEEVPACPELRWGANDSLVFARLETKHLLDQSEKVIHESLFLRFGGKVICITGDADPVLFAKSLQEKEPAAVWLREKKLFPVDIMVVNPFFIFLKPGIRFLESVNPEAVLVYHVPVEGSDDFRYRDILEKGIKRCSDRLPLIPLDKYGMDVEFPLD